MEAPRYQWLECQSCGTPLRELSLAEQQIVARKPYNFIVYCISCKKDILADEFRV